MVHQIHRLNISQLNSPRIRRFRDYWQARRVPQRIVPLRADLDPTELQELLPNIVIIEVEQKPLRFRYRLVGTRVVEFNKLDFTGLYLGTIGWDEEQQLVEACTDVVKIKEPLYGFYTWTQKNGNIGKCEFGLFPFSRDGETVMQLFGIEDYEFPRVYGSARPRALP
ncbi:PAS domain-containing protein [Dongia deserti]|uniref:PAS domain-containing protein n=1 Tax=Dongia deserti TaxID=2268030 RepID=UPI000E652273|nr:PAS domain-containing protein [Dongia deserti]